MANANEVCLRDGSNRSVPWPKTRGWEMGAQDSRGPESRHHFVDGDWFGHGGMGGEWRSHLSCEYVGGRAWHDGACIFYNDFKATHQRTGAMAGCFQVVAVGPDAGRGFTGF